MREAPAGYENMREDVSNVLYVFCISRSSLTTVSDIQMHISHKKPVSKS